MAAQEELIKSLKKNYDRKLFAVEVLSPVFGSLLEVYSSLQRPAEQPNNTESKVIEDVGIYGRINLEDDVEVLCYEIILKDHVRIDQSKVAIQHYVRKLLTSGQAALINFVSPTYTDMWRFTLVAKDSELTSKGIQEKATHPKRYTFLVESGRNNKTFAERMEWLSLESDKTMESLVEAFSVEKMSNAFFDEYKEHYQNFVQYLTGKRMVRKGSKWQEEEVSQPSVFLKSIFNGNEKDARDFCKKLLGRIVFLYFVQKKRWLGASDTEYEDGSQNFVFEIFEETGGDERFFPHGLTELFFNALNKERPDDLYETPGGREVRIPYLNGGLFTRDEVDELLHKKGDIMTFPYKLFSNEEKKEDPLPKNASIETDETYEYRGFLDFLNAFNFTVYEDSQDDHTVAVDPEMLGHIFENLLEDNKDKGAYYTPKEIVNYMCQESLLEYLNTHLGDKSDKEELGQLVREKEPNHLSKDVLQAVNEKLDEVKICDPAIGSGAFPMGLLQEIFSIKEIIAYQIDLPWDPAKTKEDIIQNSIYGVDIEKGAVDIARLRFWLSLVVDKDKPKALPNLDYKIMQGNSLVESYEGIDLSNVAKSGNMKVYEPNKDLFGNYDDPQLKFTVEKGETSRAIEKLINQYYSETKTQKKEKIREQIDHEVYNHIEFNIELRRNQLERWIKESGNYNNLSGKGKKQVDQWKIDLVNLDVAKKQLIQDRKKPYKNYFLWHLYFKDVFDHGGFDVVIANPPYIKEYTSRKAFDGFRDSPYYQGKMDLWYGFACKMIDFLKADGVECFIAQNNWITSSGASKFRDKVLSETKIVLFTDFNDYKVFKSAGIQTMIYVLKKDIDNSQISSKVQYTLLRNSNIEEEDLKYVLDFNINYEGTEKAKINFNPTQYLGGYISFRDYKYQDILNAIAVKGSHRLEDSEIIQGIVPNPDVVNSRNIKKISNVSNVDVGDGVFVVDKNHFSNLSNKELKYLKPLVEPTDTERYGDVKNSSKNIIYISKSNYKNDAPSLIKHLEKYRGIMDERRENQNGRLEFYHLHWPRDSYFFDKGEKILSIRKCASPSFIYTTEEIYVMMSFNIIRTDRFSHKFLTGLLNSTLIKFWLEKKGKLQGGQFQVDKEPLLEIPIYPENSSEIERFVEYVLFLYRFDEMKLAKTYFEQIIDGIVYELYFPDLLTKYGRQIIPHLGELPALKDSMSDQEKLAICKRVFERLDNKEHPVRNNIFYMDSIPEIRIIEGKDNE